MKFTRNYSWMAILVISLLLSACSQSPVVGPSMSLPRSSPEREGVYPGSIIRFIDAVAKSQHQFHSFMIVRHGKVVAEGWWKPYRPELRHTLYSTSKSFTSTAIGLAVKEKLLKVDDKVVSFFPNDLPDTISPYLAQLTIKDLLTMSVGQDPDPTFSLSRNDTNWVKAFLALPIVNEPGSKFLYNSMATYMLSAIIQHVTGATLIEYLKPRLFDPLGIKGMDWEVDPRGINTGGWGLRLKTEDMAKFGQLYLNKGKWGKKKLIPAGWVEEATTFKIDQAPGVEQSVRDSSDWMQGYCYQFWRCRNNAFRADGAYGQYIIVLPEKDAVIVITSESPDMQDEINLVWEHLLPGFKDEPQINDPALMGILEERLANLSLPLPSKNGMPEQEQKLAGKQYIFEQNDFSADGASFRFSGDSCLLSLQLNGIDYTLVFGSGAWFKSETMKPGPNLLRGNRAGEMGLLPAKVAGAFHWEDNNTLRLINRYIESPHYEVYTFRFNNKETEMSTWISVPPGRELPVVKGQYE